MPGLVPGIHGNRQIRANVSWMAGTEPGHDGIGAPHTMPEPPRFDPDLEWLDLVRPVGLVVAPSLLKELGLTPEL